MSTDTDFYTTLGVPKSASQDEIKMAYRKLAHQHHPDKQGGDEKKFKEINEAYQVLSDPKKRSQYDQFGSAFGSQGAGGFGGSPFGGAQGGGFDGFDFSQGFGGFRQGGQNLNFEDIFDIFGEAFGGRGRAERREREEYSAGEDIKVNLSISLYEAARGANKQIELNKDIVCPECNGSGAERGTSLVNCSVCDGRGEVRETSASFFGNITRVYACNVCRGSGKVPKTNCHACKGEGKKRTSKIIEFKMPAGINDGEALVIKGEGQAGFRGKKSGDLYVQVRVEPDKRFRRVGNDIICDMQVKMTDAILGAHLPIQTLDGEKEIEIPAGTQNGEQLRLKGLGIHGPHKGDQIVKIKIETPRKLSSKAKKLVEELAGEL